MMPRRLPACVSNSADSSTVVVPTTAVSDATSVLDNAQSITSKSTSVVAKSTASSSRKASLTSTAKATSAAAVGDGTACTASEYAQITSVVASCTNIVLDNISAPASSTIDLSALQTGSTVTFAGTTVGPICSRERQWLEAKRTSLLAQLPMMNSILSSSVAQTLPSLAQMAMLSMAMEQLTGMEKGPMGELPSKLLPRDCTLQKVNLT